MNLFLEREIPDAQCTLGTLYLDGSFECFTLELPWLNNLPEVSSIPEGRYEIKLGQSAHFHRIVPVVQNVPGRSAIEIHPLNWAKQSKGCIGVGEKKGPDMILDSRLAFDALFPKIQNALENWDHVFITIENHKEKQNV